MSIQGADVEALRTLARRFDDGAHTLERLRTAIGPSSPASAWSGPDGDGFRQTWSGHVNPSLTAVEQVLQHAAATLRSNAAAQEKASATLGDGSIFAGATATATGTSTVADTSSDGSSSDDGSDDDDGPWSSSLGPSAKHEFGGDDEPDYEGKVDGVDDDDDDAPKAGPHGSVEGGVSVDPSTGQVTGSASGDAGHTFTFGKTGSFDVGLLGGVTFTSLAVTKKGFTTYTSTSDISAGAQAALGAKGLSVSGRYVRGDTTEYEVRVPEGTDASTVDATRPETMPTGSSVTVKGGHYVDESGSVDYRGATVEGDTKNSDGTSTVVEKTGENTVRITAGPTQGIENVVGVGADLGIAKIMLSGTESVDYGAYRTADLDLRTPAGADAYQQYVQHGSFPAQATDGVTGTTHIDKYDMKTSSDLSVDIPHVGSGGLNLGSAAGHAVQITRPDGTGSTSFSFDGVGPGHAEISLPFDAHGQPVPADNSYMYRFTADHPTAELLNTSQLTGISLDGPVSTGDTVSVNLNQGEMSTVLQNAHSAAHTNPNSGLQVYTHDYGPAGSGAGGHGTAPVDDPSKFGFELASLPQNQYAFVNVLTQIDRDSDGDPLVGTAPFPGTATVAK